MSIMQFVFNKKGYEGILKMDDLLITIRTWLLLLSFVLLFCLTLSTTWGFVPPAVSFGLCSALESYRIRMWRKLDLGIKIPYVIRFETV